MDQLLMACRFAHFSAAMLLFGGSVFSGTLLPKGLRNDGNHRGPAIALGGIVALTAVVWLGVEAGEAGDGWADAINPATIASVVTDTSFGQVWLWRLLLIAVLLMVVTLLGPGRRWAQIVVSAAVLASLALVGHATMDEGSLGLAHRLNDALHLLGAGFWLGSLPALLLMLRRLAEPAWQNEATTALRRFSGLGHLAVALALVTGMINTYLILGHPPLDFSSSYQRLLAAKLGLVLLMVMLAIANRYVIVPRLLAGDWSAVRVLRVGTTGELVMGAGVVALVSVFGASDPGA